MSVEWTSSEPRTFYPKGTTAPGFGIDHQCVSVLETFPLWKKEDSRTEVLKLAPHAPRSRKAAMSFIASSPMSQLLQSIGAAFYPLRRADDVAEVMEAAARVPASTPLILRDVPLASSNTCHPSFLALPRRPTKSRRSSSTQRHTATDGLSRLCRPSLLVTSRLS